MDRTKIRTMFGKFLLGLLADEVAESDQVVEDLTAEEPTPELYEAPEGGWPSKYDEYMFGVTNHIIKEYGLDKESATELVLGTAGALAERKCLPAVMQAGDEHTAEEFHDWVAKAESLGFQKVVIDVAERIMKEAIEEIASEPDEDE